MKLGYRCLLGFLQDLNLPWAWPGHEWLHDRWGSGAAPFLQLDAISEVGATLRSHCLHTCSSQIVQQL